MNTRQTDPSSSGVKSAGSELPVNPNPYIPPIETGPRRQVMSLKLTDPLRWLALGWRDLRAEPAIGLFYGLSFWVMALVLGFVFRSSPEYTMSLASGCLLLGPFLAMGLYDVSRRRQSGKSPNLASSLTCWDAHVRSMGLFVLVLIVLELLWGRASLVIFAVFFNTGMPSTTNVLQAVFNPDNLEFLLTYLVVGGVFAALVFACSVVSIPMILDRDTDAITAVIASLQVFFENLGVMLLWGAIISVLVVSAMIFWGVGLVLVGPWLGYSSWHDYRGSIRWMDEAAGELLKSSD